MSVFYRSAWHWILIAVAITTQENT